MVVASSLAFVTGALQSYEFKLGGFADQSAFIGFNNSKINREKGIYPTERYATITGYLGLDMDLLPKNTKDHSLKAKIGGIVGGVLYDGTKSKQGGSIISDIFGDYNGFMGGYKFLSDDENFIVSNGDKTITRNYTWSDIYIDYQYKQYFGFKGWRYKSSMAYQTGHTQGFEVYGGFKDFRLTWFSSFGRAFATGSYIKDWYAPRTTYYGNYTKNAQGGWDSHGAQTFLGTHALQVNYQRHKLSLEGFFYFSPKIYNAPGFKVAWDSNPNFTNRGFRSQTSILAFFPIYYPWMVINSSGGHIYQYGRPVTQNGQSLAIKQRFDFNEFYLVGTFLKNFKNPNYKIGNMGNPAGVEFGSDSAWVGIKGPAITGDAVTGNIGYGGSHFKDKFVWQMQWQWTSAPVAYAARVGVLFQYTFNKILSATVDLSYYGIHTRKGYQPDISTQACIAGQNTNPEKPSEGYIMTCQGGYQDRSSLTTSLVATF
ncbi:outer membrane family protein [Helicobacter baculiformis]|uniref:outer membrane family protein n=1 Tax=Helicobacter baculiformis TaxID=427351 RepID=UPI000CF13C7C|nr:outer membrane family protein [Helicobacter baculiformis]